MLNDATFPTISAASSLVTLDCLTKIEALTYGPN